MSTLTPNYQLVKPSLSDTADITAMNGNWDTIDGMLGIANTFRATEITSGTDLNSKTTSGVYQCKTNSIAATLSNSPTTSAFSMAVFPHTANGVVQIITEYMTSGAKQYRRNKNNSTWGDWVEIATGTDISDLEARIDFAKYDDASPKQEIKATYIKDVSVSGRTMTVTKGNGIQTTHTLQDTTYSVATPDASGLMSAADKAKLDSLQVNTNNFEVKTYVGNGRHGPENPNSITFSFVPKQVVFLNAGYQNTGNVYGYGSGNSLVNMVALTTSYVDGTGPFAVSSHNVSYFHSYAKKSSDGKTLYWYVTVSGCNVADHKIAAQLNIQDVQYAVLAIR